MAAPTSTSTPSLQWPLRHFNSLRLSWMVGFSLVLVLAVAWGTVVTVLQIKWRDAMNAEVRQNQNLARALREQTIRVLASVDQATLRMRDEVLGADFDPQDYERFANETGLVPKILTQLSLVGPDGRFMGSNIDPGGTKTGNVDLSDREHVRIHLTPEKAPEAERLLVGNGLFIGKPVLGKVSGKWTIQLSRKIARPDGTPLGVVVASVNPTYFEQVYLDVKLGDAGGVSLIGTDNTIRARVVGGRSEGIGTTIPKGTTRLETMTEPEGYYTATSKLDGIERVYAYQQVGDYPLRVVVSSDVDAALSEWRAMRNGAIILTALFTLVSVAGGILFLLGVRRLEAQNKALQISEAQAQSASQAKSEFLAAVSHELRTPLTSIRGFSELMELKLENPKHREQASLIRKAAEHLNAVLSEILDLAKVEAGAMPILVSPQSPRELVQSSADFFAITAASKGLDLRVEWSDTVPETLTCDGLRIKQVLNNLMSNALKFTVQGSVTLSVDATATAVNFHVIDTGPGIPPELHETIFEKFRQANERVSYEHGGTGLGLALSRALAGLMGGSLTLDSDVGRGAHFTLTLPRL